MFLEDIIMAENNKVKENETVNDGRRTEIVEVSEKHELKTFTERVCSDRCTEI